MFWFKKKATCRCEVCQKKFLPTDAMPIKNLGFNTLEGLKRIAPNYNHNGWICRVDLRKIRTNQIRTLFAHHKIEGCDLEEILLKDDASYTFSLNQAFQSELSFGEKISEKITPFIGSWGFILSFLLFIGIWMGYNTQTEVEEHYDPFPFILLNLFLSCMAAIQAPIIMMAQNRNSKRDRLRADEEYYMELRAELELRQLNEKINTLLNQ